MLYRIRFVAIFLLFAALAVFACLDVQESAGENGISYNFQIRPLLSDKCFACHGPDANKREAGLRLDLTESAFAPLRDSPGKFAIVPGKPEQSELYLRITSPDSSVRMPPPESHLGVLTPAEIELFRQWILEGATYEPHWAFIKPQKKALPKIKDKNWPHNEIDHFILAKMEAQGLAPNEAADKERLLKRLSFDLTGLPPSPEMMDRFLADKSDQAYEKMIDELLAMPQYGEKMAVHWLDVARYADSYGYQDDNIRTQWPWRDWVIHAFNQDLPYDEFLRRQIAGDLLPDSDKEKMLATAFFRNHKYTEEGGVIPEEYRMTYLEDKTNTFAKGILGVTLECAQCHDHKYDPFAQADYYAMLAFFNNTKEEGYEGDVSVSKPAKTPILRFDDADVQGLLKFINKPDTGAMMVSVMKEDTFRKTYILNRGVYDKPGAEVQAAALPAVLAFSENKYPRNRLGLASWTVDRDNPLTARVFVNQIWQEIFGRGIVKTSGDFGMQGELPSHPALLDWLAADFMENGWQIKRLLRQIVVSATYRQSTAVSEEKLRRDPENIYLARGPRNRLSAEHIRDMLLASSGLLNKKIGGPSVKPYQPKGLWESATSGRGVLARYVQDEGEALYRRGMYTFIKLTVPPPSMILFDGSNRDQCEVKRLKTNTPLQALVMMNDPTMLEAARVLAQRLHADGKNTETQIAQAFRLILCRKPKSKESALLKTYFEEQLNAFRNRQLDAVKTLQIGEYPLPQGSSEQAMQEMAALAKTLALIYNMEEAITKS
ncbi:MAG: PSD1 domain-containing protein [Chitinophagales bacterium]|nr:PSD1 domain-containing protein [Chitinophagales bacterium]